MIYLSPSAVRRALLTGAVLLIALTPALAQEKPAGPEQRFTKKEALIPMRDGVRLNTAIYTPKESKDPLPFIFFRTPYGIDRAAGSLGGYMKELADEGYIFVFQDIRGRYKSEGQFAMCRPPRDRSDPKAIDESTDAFDTIEWLLKNVPGNNGRAGMLGVSYPGWLTVMALMDPHPALKAVSPQASPADMFLNDDFHHNGAFRLSYGFEYVVLLESSKTNTDFKFDRADTFEWYLRLGSLGHADERYFHGKMPTWNDFVSHPNYDGFWKKQAFADYLNQVKVPALHVAGWWDQEDFSGALKIYQSLEKHDAKNQNYLVVGPWNHGGWAGGEGKSLGKIAFDQPTSKYFREKVQAPWFAHFLKDKGKLEQPEALLFETGSNRWVRHEQWPPRQGVTPRKLYFQPNGRLSFDAPGKADEEFDSYVSDPAHPVPYRQRPIEPTYPGPGWPVWLTEDQRFVHLRPDVLSWETEPLTEEVTLAGDIVAHFFAATSGTDSDWVVKLIDVYPDDYKKDARMRGYQLMVASEVFRGRFRKGYDKPEPVKPNDVNEYSIDLYWRTHSFQKGHKIMVQVQSTWFPVIDRNPQKFVANIFQAKDADYQKATQRVYRTEKYPSYISLPVVERLKAKQ